MNVNKENDVNGSNDYTRNIKKNIELPINRQSFRNIPLKPIKHILKAYYKENAVAENIKYVTDPPPSNLRLPNWINQFKIFITRDFLSKINNLQYIILNLADEVFLMIAELANKAFQFDIEDKEVRQGIASTVEILMRAYGVAEEDWYNFAAQYDEAQAKELMTYMEDIQ